VTLDYDPAATEETQETYDPDQTVTLSMQRTEQTTGPQAIPAGVPGTASNAPNSQALPVYPQQSTQPQSAKTESGTYGASKTTRHMVENPGKVRRMTAAIVVNDRLATAAGKGKLAQWQPRTADELRHLTALAQAAVGYDTARGDLLTVEDLAFDDNRPPVPPTIQEQILATAQSSQVLIKYAALLLGLLVVLALGVRPALARLSAPPKFAAQKALPGSVAAPPVPVIHTQESLALEAERARVQEIFDQVTGHLKQEPTQSSRLLQSWIHSD
jgi:flagellar M-ring protein FliF